MKRMILIAGTAAALMVGGWTQPEEMPAGMPDMDAMIAMMDAASKPDDAHHAYLKKMDGDWVTTAKFTMVPGSPPEISMGTSKNKLVLGGRQLMAEVDMDMKIMGKIMKFNGIGLIGYNKGSSQFESVWMDTMGTGQLRQVGTMDDGNIVIEGSSKNPMMGEFAIKNIYKFVDGGYDMEFWEQNSMTQGKMMNTGVIEYRRAETKRGNHDGHGHD